MYTSVQRENRRESTRAAADSDCGEGGGGNDSVIVVARGDRNGARSPTLASRCACLDLEPRNITVIRNGPFLQKGAHDLARSRDLGAAPRSFRGNRKLCYTLGRLGYCSEDRIE